MLIKPVSDFHSEFYNTNGNRDKLKRILDSILPPTEQDKDTVLTIAGDLGLAHKPYTWLHSIKHLANRYKAIVYVEGNHFFYHNTYFDKISILKKEVALPKNVHFLENEFVKIEDVVFIGATLWTSLNNYNPIAMEHARRNMNDFQCIRWDDNRKILPEDTVDKFYKSKQFIFDCLREFRNEKTVVVTHHAPSDLSIAEVFRGDLLNYAYYTELYEDIKECGPDYWFHGHMHKSFDYVVGETRVMVNPYGYKDVERNLKFNPNLIVEI